MIRTKIIKPGYQDSKGSHLSYFIGNDIINRYAGIPLVSLISDPDGMFGDNNGIYVPGLDANGNPNTTATANYQQDWERLAHIQLWEANRNLGFETGAAMKIHGSASARLNRKGLRMNFKSSLGFPNLSYPLLNPQITESYDAFLIRAAGQDAHHLQFRDAIGQVFFRTQDLGSTPFRPSILFINGEYWGLHNLRERSDEDFIARIYAANVNKMDCLEHRGVANPDERVGTRSRYMDILNFVKNNNPDDPEVYNSISQMLDIQNYINYYIAQIFVANSDWPSYNVRMWRHKPELDNPGVFYQENPDNPKLDGRFRWILFDLDQSLGRFHNANTNTLQNATVVGTWNDNFFILFRKLIGATNSTGVPVTDNNGLFSNGSTAFRTQFINNFCDALNTYLLPSRTTAMVTDTQALYAPYMEEHIQRWGVPSSISSWNSIANGVRSFLNARPAALRTHLANKFQLINGTANLSLSINNPQMGYIKLNSIKLGANTGFEPLPFSGTYFKDVPISIEAVPNPGYRFVGFSSGFGSDLIITLNLTGDIQINAIFEVDEEDFAGDALNPEPHNLNLGPYSFLGFDPQSPMSVYPPNMRFLMSPNPDPNINAEMNIAYTSSYNLDARTRIEGLSGNGIAFINTGNPPSDGSTSGYLGAAVLGLKSSGRSGLKLSFSVETLEVNSRLYGLALQYRIGSEGAFSDVMLDGVPLRYIRNSLAGHKQTFNAIPLPALCDNQPYIQIRWKYYYISGASGARPKLRLDDIFVYDDAYMSPSTIVINEIMSSINTWEHPLAADDFSEKSDWIELYNAGTEAQNLHGCYLSDNSAQNTKWMFPSVNLAPGEFLLIRASNRNIQLSNAILHSNFAISSSGEPIILSAPDGTILDFVDSFAIPTDFSYARIPDATDNWQIQANPSPMAPNISISAPHPVFICVEEDNLRISWQAVNGALGYRIYAADSPDALIWNLIDTVQEPIWISNREEHPSLRFFRISAF